MNWESSGVVGFDLGLPLQGQMRITTVNSAYSSIVIGLFVLEFWDSKPTCRIS